jgi:hypothetical protein
MPAAWASSPSHASSLCRDDSVRSSISSAGAGL